MWQIQEIERIAKERLIQERGEAAGEDKYGLYTNARRDLVEEILEQIRAMEPALTDHGSRHIANVLKNAGVLLGGQISEMTPTELYCLSLSILFHDVGNLHGRQDHQHKITAIYDYVRPRREQFKQEKSIVLRVVAAHCGAAADNSNDTLKFLDTTSLDEKPVNLRKIAAILRFADELAEGQQRTSLFMQEFGYPRDSEIYHQYATATNVSIDRENGRIALTYNVEVKINADGSLADEDQLRQFISFIYKRILKLDQERRYARHYCPLLNPFKEVSAVIAFWVNNEPVDLALSPLVLTDLVVPGDVHKDIGDYDKSYSMEELLGKIRRFLSSLSGKQEGRPFLKKLCSAFFWKGP